MNSSIGLALIITLRFFTPVGWAGEPSLPQQGLMLDLDADKAVETQDGRVVKWSNQAAGKARDFVATRDDGRPGVHRAVEALRGHDALIFRRQELVNLDEDAFDHLLTGSGYTWLAVLCADRQNPGLKDVNSFFGNLKNSGNFEGFWGGFNDDNTIWIGSRNSTTFGRWNSDNPKVLGPKLEVNRFYVVAGRMGAGQGEVKVELFVNESLRVASLPFPVNAKANASKMAIGQERDAANHPGKESFTGEIARMLIWERPLADDELRAALTAMKQHYGIGMKTAESLVWTGTGADSLWTNPDNWSGKRIPGESDDVVLNATSDKTSTFNTIEGKGREAKGLTIRSLTISPDYKGVFQIQSPGRVIGSARLAGQIEMRTDAHVSFQVDGPEFDLAKVQSIKTRFAGGSFALRGVITQTFTPPADTAILMADLQKLGGGTLKLAGSVNAISVRCDNQSTLDLNGHDITTQLLQIAGPIQHLGGRTITVTGAVGYTINAIGFMRGGGDALAPIDLAPQEPWKLVVKKGKLLVLYGLREEWEFNLLNCKLGNCDVTGSEVPVWAYKGSTDAGNNKGIDFNPTLPDRTVKKQTPPAK